MERGKRTGQTWVMYRNMNKVKKSIENASIYYVIDLDQQPPILFQRFIDFDMCHIFLNHYHRSLRFLCNRIIQSSLAALTKMLQAVQFISERISWHSSPILFAYTYVGDNVLCFHKTDISAYCFNVLCQLNHFKFKFVHNTAWIKDTFRMHIMANGMHGNNWIF